MPIGVSMDPEVPVRNLIEQHFPEGEKRQAFDSYMTELNAAEKSGRLGTDPEEKYQAMQHLLKKRYPEFMNEVYGLSPTGQRGTGSPDEGSQHDLDLHGEFGQYLANRGM